VAGRASGLAVSVISLRLQFRLLARLYGPIGKLTRTLIPSNERERNGYSGAERFLFPSPQLSKS